jgi:hypothetical protein
VLLIEVIVGLTVFMLLVILSTAAARYPRPITTDTILFLARIGRRAEIDEQVALRIDNERVHRMITVSGRPETTRCGRSLGTKTFAGNG